MRLTGKISLSGPGLHSGAPCSLSIEPDCSAAEIFLANGSCRLPLRLLRTDGSNRGSDYSFPDGSSVRTCEHVFSALTGLEIFSGVNIIVSGGEMPALDGCSQTLCTEIIRHSDPSGFSPGPEPLAANEPLIASNQDSTRFIAVFPCDELRITYVVKYDYIGAQIFDYVQTPENYIRNIAQARTFAMKSEIDYLRSHGMALGGTLDNAIAVGDEIQAKGGLHWEDEFVRHKVLDLIGDLASLGRKLHGHIIAVRAGHELHLKLAEKLKQKFNLI